MEQLDIHQLMGETTEYDKKQAMKVKKSKSWCKSVSAFSNGIGGKLVWGIANDDTLIGLADIFSRLKYMERRGSGFKKYKGHDGYIEDMVPISSTPWDNFVLVLPKFNIDDVEGVYISSDDVIDYGSQTDGQTNVDTIIAEVLRLIKENPQITKKVLSKPIGIASSAIQKHIN